MDDSPKGIMDLTIDVRDVPCDEPFDEDERVLVQPDTLNGQIRMHVVVRNRDCCCCGDDGRGDLGMLRGARRSSPPDRLVPPPVSETPPDMEEAPIGAVVAPVAPLGLAPLLASPGLRPATGASYDVVFSDDSAGIPWWIALAAAPAVLLFGRDSGEVCENDETGRTSGPSRTC